MDHFFDKKPNLKRESPLAQTSSEESLTTRAPQPKRINLDDDFSDSDF